MPSPRLRSDLEAQPVDDGGLRFFDVHDPRSGSSMRLYEHEWLIARRMDGRESLDDVAAWAGQHVGFSPTTSDLRGYVDKLEELGFFDPAVLDTLPQQVAGRGRSDETSFEDLDSPSGPPPAPMVARPPARVTQEVAASELSGPPALPVFADHNSASPIAATLEMPAPRLPPRPVAPPAAPVLEKRPPATSEREPKRGETDRQDPVEAPRKSRGGLIGLGIVALLAVVCGAAYFYVLAPALAPAHVKVQAIGGPRDLTRHFDGKGVVAKAEGAMLSFTGTGTVVDVVAKGAEVKAGQTLASLAGYAAAQKALNDVRDREQYYEDALKKAQARHKRSDEKRAQSKVNEKHGKRVALEEKVAGARIVSSISSTVDEVLVKAGDAVTPGSAAIKLADKKLSADVKVSAADAKTFKVDAVVPVSNAAGNATGEGRIKAIEGDTVKLELTNDGAGAFKAGEEVRLVKSKIVGVIRVPAAADVKSQGGADQVFVLVGEIVRARPVTVAERGPDEVFVSAGLAKGERVVMSPAPTLQDGQKALAE